MEIGACGDVVGGIAQHGFDLGQLAAEHAGDGVELFAHVFCVGLGEDGADGRGDHLGDPLGTWANTLRRKFTRHLCQLAPIRMAWIALRSPMWASEITSCTPGMPRVFSDRRNPVQKAPSSLSPTSKPSTSRRPSAATPVAITAACETNDRLSR